MRDLESIVDAVLDRYHRKPYVRSDGTLDRQFVLGVVTVRCGDRFTYDEITSVLDAYDTIADE